MKFNNYDVCVITDEKQRLYLLGFHSTAGHVILTKEKTVFVVDRRYYYAANEKLCKSGIEVVCGSDYTYLKELVYQKEYERIGIDFAVTTVREFNRLKMDFSGCELVDIGEELQLLASVKSEEEIKNIAVACEIAEKSFLQILPLLKEGITESEVAAHLEFAFKQNGASDKSFDTIVGFGANSAVPHHETGSTKLVKNTVVLMDFGCVYNGYCSDMTRTFFFGENPDEEFVKAYKAVYDAHFAALVNMKEGMSGAQIDGFARDLLTQRGYGEYFTHSLGHGIGVHIHEYPWLAPKRDNKVTNGMVFSNEPGVYFDGKFGIRIEDSLYMANGVAVSFMKEDKKLMLINDGKITKINLE